MDVADTAKGALVLAPRLAAVADMVPAGSVVADIGTDHATLPIALVRAHRAPRAIASEVAPAPFENARRVVAEAGLASLIDVRFGSGLSVLEPGEAESIVLAGMGAWTILDIIHARPEVARAAAALVLQPQTEPVLIRRTLAQEGFSLGDERLAREGEHFYVVMAYHWSGEAGSGATSPALLGSRDPAGIPDDLLWEIGPRLVAARDRLLAPFLEQLAAIEEQKLAGQGRGATSRAHAAQARTAERLAALNRLLSQLQTS